MKLHIGCGPVYLQGYTNIDARADFVVPDVPEDLFELNKTVFENYYKHEFCKGSGKTVADLECKIQELPFNNGSVDEIILFHILEHIPKYELSDVLTKINSLLKLGGNFTVAVPDVKGFATMLSESKTEEDDEWCLRLIYGTQRDKFCHHFCGYTDTTLKKLLKEFGFGNFINLPNINFYPAIHLCATKVNEL